jgi:NHL repeat
MKQFAIVLVLISSVALAAQRASAPTPDQNGMKSKAPEQGWVGEGWNPHEGGLLKMKVQIRFGVERQAGVAENAWKQMPAGWVFGRVSAVSVDARNNVYVLHRNTTIDPVVVFDQNGNYLRSWGKGAIGDPHGIRVDKEGNVWVVDRANALLKYTADGKLLRAWGTRGVKGNDERPSICRPTWPGTPRAIPTSPTATATPAW